MPCTAGGKGSLGRPIPSCSHLHRPVSKAVYVHPRRSITSVVGKQNRPKHMQHQSPAVERDRRFVGIVRAATKGRPQPQQAHSRHAAMPSRLRFQKWTAQELVDTSMPSIRNRGANHWIAPYRQPKQHGNILQGDRHLPAWQVETVCLGPPPEKSCKHWCNILQIRYTSRYGMKG